ncbi:saccharopine dehydrogenase family protein [Emcibacter nanhaiensis]|nr:DUF5938 domain-containing protein [Emcibacter nanhaiensis]
MPNKRPVIVYGASGYTGRLICEFLREYRIPFIAAGRNQARLETAMEKVPGIETADYEIREVDHTVDALAGLFDGAQVVCNSVGPFELYGETVIQACLKAGTHYLDTTGEQHFVLPVKEKFSDDFQKAGLLLAPSTAYMHATLDIAVSFAAAEHGITTINAHCAAAGVPTYGSTQTVVRSARAQEFFLKDRKLQPWARGKKYEVQLPLWGEPQLSLPWTGTALPIWYEGHRQIENLKALVCFADNRSIMEQVFGLISMYDEQISDKSAEEQEAILTQLGESIQNGMPPRENRQVHRNFDRAVGFGPRRHVEYRVHSTASYQQTGLLQAFAANQLLADANMVSGFASPCQAFGHEAVLSALEDYGYAHLEKAI